MGLLEDIQDEQVAGRYIKCPVARLMADMSDADTADLNAAMAEEGITNAAIARALARRGLTVRADSVGNHRFGRCACPR